MTFLERRPLAILAAGLICVAVVAGVARAETADGAFGAVAGPLAD